MCTDCFNIVAGIDLLEDDLLAPRFIISFFTPANGTRLNENASAII